MTFPVRILLVDDSRDFLASAADFLRTQSGIKAAGVAASGEEALDLVARISVDLVLLDLNMRGLSGIETARALKARPNAPKIIIVTLQEAPEYRHLALAAGADGFIGKSKFTDALLPLITSLFPEMAVPPPSSQTGANLL